MSAGPGGQAGLLNGTGTGAAAGLLSPGEPAHQLIYASPYADYANYAALTAAANPLLTAEYAAADHTGGLFARWPLKQHVVYDNTCLHALCADCTVISPTTLIEVTEPQKVIVINYFTNRYEQVFCYNW